MNLKLHTLTRFRRLVSLRSLPRATPWTRRTAAAVAVCGGVVGLVALQLGLGLMAEQSHVVKDPGYADKERTLARLEAANPGAFRVLMLGTSRTGYGFHAGRIQRQLAADPGRPVTVFNFGIPASGPVTHVVYARRLFDQGHRPDLLLLEVLPPGLAELPDGPLESKFLFGDRLRRSEAEAVIGYDFPASETRSKWRQSVANPWYTLRFPLMGRVSPSAVPWHLRFDWSRTTDPHGWSTPLVETVSPEDSAAGLIRASAEYRAILADMHPGGGAARALADLLALCRGHGIPVRLVLMPESVGFRALYPSPTTSRLYAFLHRLCAEYGCELTDARDWLPDTAFTDGHHQLRSGAEAFSDRLTRDVIRPLVRPAPRN